MKWYNVESQFICQVVLATTFSVLCTSNYVRACNAEGDPYSDSVAAILRFQQLTMEAMYDTIHQALRAMGSERMATDYLQFMCLGKRDEGTQDGPETVKGKAAAGVLSHRCRQLL